MAVDISTTIVIDRPRREVAAYVAKPDNAPHWYVNIKQIRWLTTPPVVVGSRIAFAAQFLGRRLEYVYEVAEYAPGERLVMRTAQGPFPMETTYAWESTADDHTQMTLRNRGAPSGFSAIAAPAMAAAMRRANARDLARLKTILERGVGTQESADGTETAGAA